MVAITQKETQTALVEFKLSGQVEKQDIKKIASTLEQALAKHDQISILIEMDVQEVTFGAVMADISFGIRHLGDLYRIEKLGVLTDQNWIKTIVKWESKVVRTPEMQVFPVSEREKALEWISESHDTEPGITYHDSPRGDILSFALKNKITGFDLRDLRERVDKICQEHGKVNLLAIDVKVPKLGKGALIEDLKMFDLLKQVRRYAVVTDTSWLKTYVSFVNPLVSVEIKHFEAEKEAVVWLQDV